MLKLDLGLGEALEAAVPHPCVLMIAAHAGIIDRGRPADTWLAEVCDRLAREGASPSEFRIARAVTRGSGAGGDQNLRPQFTRIIVAAPAGARTVLGIDPGLPTGCKIAVIDATGKLLDTATIYPHQPRNDWRPSLDTLSRLVMQHRVKLIAIGNGTGSRETDKLAAELVKLVGGDLPQQKLAKVMVSEAGASVYSASAFAAAEFPALDVTLRGAVSIARHCRIRSRAGEDRSRSIGVGRYQHDVNQRALARSSTRPWKIALMRSASMEYGLSCVVARVSGLNRGSPK